MTGNLPKKNTCYYLITKGNGCAWLSHCSHCWFHLHFGLDSTVTPPRTNTFFPIYFKIQTAKTDLRTVYPSIIFAEKRVYSILSLKILLFLKFEKSHFNFERAGIQYDFAFRTLISKHFQDLYWWIACSVELVTENNLENAITAVATCKYTSQINDIHLFSFCIMILGKYHTKLQLRWHKLPSSSCSFPAFLQIQAFLSK